ncbi:DUF4430 domain-containing protein [Massilibacterium senegalense]|uniref:DUF4430 domain-containing protein n=1 Tax=Massilibacterium senegalense TaxID=1632858 RepID=UPI000782CAB5|nr:DUF4430 domain-containing protein [Massilibacterium senegalense]
MRKDLLSLAFVILLIAVLASGTKIQSVDEYYLTHIDDITEDSETVTISIHCDTILDNWDQLSKELRSEKYVPKDGVILKQTEYVLRPGDTVFDILQRTVRHNKIHMEFQGADQNAYGSVYIQGINHLYEFSCGPLSGWMYAVNEEYPDYGVSKYKLKDGDVIEFNYTCDLGRDLGYEFSMKNKGD